MLEEPVTYYEVSKQTNFSMGSIHSLLQEYLRKGIIKIVREEPTRVRKYTKKYYQLTNTGRLLLKLAKAIESF